MQLALAAFLFLFPILAMAQASSYFTYEGYLTLDDTPLHASNVPLQVRIYGNSGSRCLLYEESHSVTVVNGSFKVLVGTGNTPTGLAFTQIFGSGPVMTGCSFDPNIAGASRLLNVSVNGSDMGDVVLSDAPRAMIAGYAENAERLNGRSFSNSNPANGDYLRWDSAQNQWAPGATSPVTWGSLSGVPATFSPNSHTHSVSDITSAVGQYFTYRPNNSACSTGQVLQWNGTGWICSTPSTGVVADGSLTPAKLSSGSAAGQTLRYNGTTWSSTQLSYQDLVNSSSGSPWPTTSCAAGSFITWSSVVDGFTCTALTGSMVGSALGSTVLRSANNLSDLSDLGASRANLGLGSAATKSFGTAAGDLVELDGTGRVPSALLPPATGYDGTAAGGDLSGTYPNPMIANNAVGNSQLEDSSVTESKIAVGAVTSAKLENSGVAIGTYPKVQVDVKGRVVAGLPLVATDIPTLDWSKITSGRPTSLDGFGITDAIRNAGSTVSIQSGANSSKPAPGAVGRVYIATDTQQIYRDDGSVWVLIGTGAAGGGTVTSVSTGAGLTGGPISGSGTISLALGGVATAHLASGSVTGAKIADSQITDSKIVGISASKIISGSGLYLTYRPNNIACSDGQVMKWMSSQARWECGMDNDTLIAESDPTVQGFAKTAPSADFSTPGDVLSLNTVSIAKGGTGQTTATGALNALLPSQASNAGRVLQTDGTSATWQNLAGGTVTSVGLEAPGFMTTSGPVTTSGNLSIGFSNQNANMVFAGPLSASGPPSFRTLQQGDLKSASNGNFFGMAGNCASGQHLSYSSITDSITCEAYSLTSAQVTGALGFTPPNSGAVVSRTGDTMTGALNLPTGGLRVGTGELAVVANGNVGMGTLSPTQKLHVIGGIQGDQLCIGSDCRSAWPAGGGSLPIGTSGQVLTYDGGNWVASAPSSLTNLSATSLGSGTVPAARMPAFSGDASTSAGSTSLLVTGIQGRGVSNAVPTVGQVLKFSSGTWMPMADNAGVVSVLTGGGITGGPINSGGSGTISIATNGVTEDKIAIGAVTGSKLGDGSVSAAKLNFNCPTGMVVVPGNLSQGRYPFCIDESDQSAMLAHSAESHCMSDGKTMCQGADYYRACQVGILPLSGTPNRWTSVKAGVSAGTLHVFYMSGCQIPPGSADGAATWMSFRCCVR